MCNISVCNVKIVNFFFSLLEKDEPIQKFKGLYGTERNLSVYFDTYTIQGFGWTIFILACRLSPSLIV